MRTTPADSESHAGAHQVRLDRLLGRQVLARNNQPMGRLEEFRAEKQGRDWEVVEYVIGAAGLFARLGGGVKLLFGRQGGGYVARWDQLDISDPERPRLKCAVEELRTL